MYTRTFTRQLKMFVFLTIFSSFIPASVMAMGPTVSAPVKDEIKGLILEFHEAATNADVDFMDEIFSNDPEVLLIGTDPAEVIVGHAAIVQFWSDLFQALRDLGYPNNGGLPTVSSGAAIQVNHMNSVAWAVDFPTWQFRNGDVPFRVTFVFHRKRGEWKIIQIHFSIGVPNADLPI